MQFHLSGHILPIKMSIPPAPLILIGGIGGIWSNKRNAKISLTVLYNRILLLYLRRFSGGIHYGTGGTFVFVHRCAFAVLRLPSVVDLQTAMKLMPASLKCEFVNCSSGQQVVMVKILQEVRYHMRC